MFRNEQLLPLIHTVLIELLVLLNSSANRLSLYLLSLFHKNYINLSLFLLEYQAIFEETEFLSVRLN
ncbi:TPA: hypothetical protein CPU00_00130 [Candidatus Gastranaerophilales bacterium HUM_18]|nr:MAG TPA: hypothetical protein CPU00_00130 [Candidatus Gastranaerophilales bacterium HUM_18]